MTIGILAYGSLIGDPGDEICPLITDRFPTLTPFPIEFARSSSSRGGAPTLVPHQLGRPVKAEVLVLDRSVSLDQARAMLWRREIHQVGSGREYKEREGPNCVLVQQCSGLNGLDFVLFTDFNAEGKIAVPNAGCLALLAVRSVAKAKPGKDGISYLINTTQHGIKTNLSSEYAAEVLRITSTESLSAALLKAAGSRSPSE